MLNLRITWDKRISTVKSVGLFETEYLLTSIVIMNLEPKAFVVKWAQFTKEYDEVPSYEVFLQFLKEQTRVTKDDRTGISPSKPASATTSSIGVSCFKKKTWHSSVLVTKQIILIITQNGTDKTEQIIVVSM